MKYNIDIQSLILRNLQIFESKNPLNSEYHKRVIIKP